MKVASRTKSAFSRFGGLPPGSAFWYKNDLYIKCYVPPGNANCVLFASGGMFNFSADTEVEYLPNAEVYPDGK